MADNMTPKRAEEIALISLAWIAAEPERASGFMGMSGAGLDDIKSEAENPEFLGFVLDYILMDDANIIALAEESDIAPEDVFPARQMLIGGETPEWT